MPISVRSGIKIYNPTGSLNVSLDPSPAQLGIQSDLRVGDLDCVAVIYQSPIGTSTHSVPTGFTTRSPALTSGYRLMVVYTRAIKTAAELTAAQADVQLKAAATATRVVAFRFSMVGVDLDNPINVTGTPKSSVSGDTYNFYNPVTGEFPIYFTYTNNAAAATHPTHGTVGGTILATAMALSGNTGSDSDTVLSMIQGGERTTFSMAVANGGSYGLSFNPAPVTETSPLSKLVIDGVVKNVRVKYISDNGTPKLISKLTTSSIQATDPEPGTAQASEGLWFDASPMQTPFSSPTGKVITAHAFPPYPIWIGTSDYYSNNYYPITAQSATEIHHAEGGFLDNGPIPTPLVSTDSATQAIADHKFDLKRATKIGIDVFMIDIISTSGNNLNYVNRLIQARDELGAGPYTYLSPMLDCNGPVVETGGYVVAAQHIAKHKGKNGTWLLPDGRMPIGAFKMEDDADTPPQFWVDLTRELINVHGIRPAYMAAMNTYNSTVLNARKDALTAAGYPEAFYAAGPWGMGGADPSLIASTSNYKTTAAASGLKAYYPFQAQNIRPGTSTTTAKVPAGKSSTQPRGVYDEAYNTEAYRSTWNKIIAENPELVQGVTWNDYSEGGEIQPSLVRGWCVADLTTWFGYKYLYGEFPPILRDNIILSHRSQFAFVDGPEDVTNTKQTSFLWQWERGGTETTPKDTVEALVFATGAGTLEIKVGSTVTTQAIAGAGVHSVKAPLGVGRISARLIRGGSEVLGVTSPVLVVQVPVTDDKQYFWFSALRGVTEQRDPTDNKTLTMATTVEDPPPTPTGSTPGAILNIGPGDQQNHYSVQIAVVGDTTQSHSMNEITNGYKRAEEFTNNAAGDRVRLKTWVNAPILDNSSWPRCELRGRNPDGTMQAYDARTGVHWQHLRGRLLKLPANKSEIVLQQLHNGASDRIALRIQKTGTTNNVPRLIWRVNGTQVYVFKDPIAVGDEWRAMWRVENGVVKLYDGNMTTPVYEKAGVLVATSGVNTWYDKAGNYVQSTDGSQPQNTTFYDVSTEFGSVEIWDLRHWHTGWPARNDDPLVTG